ncbi:hypothetical protein T492DRAFT_401103 [Pavlovales sp. CCMP2436]|nr:hypothetical protein T492DRAFT_401103 [Pavlovales sp. CCMP2436]
MAYFANALEPAAPAAPHSTGDRGGLGAQEWRSPAAWRQLAAGLAVAPAAVVGLRHVRLALSHHQVPPSELLWTLNAALVALCVDEREGLCAVRLDARLSALDVPSLPPGHAPSGAEEAVARAAALDAEPAGSVSLFVLPESPLADCLGLGIVRAIDVARGELHILTPLPLAQLQRVNTVVRGNLQLPAALIIGGAQPMAAMPYLTAESVTAAGAASMRSRNNLERATTARR